jgi:hypothetical protein
MSEKQTLPIYYEFLKETQWDEMLKNQSKNEIKIKKRKGVILIDQKLLLQSTELIRLIFSNFIPVKIDYDAFSERYHYYGYSLLFDEIGEGEVAPEYFAEFITVNNIEYLNKFIRLK